MLYLDLQSLFPMHVDSRYILHSLGADHILTGPPDASGVRRMVRLNESAAFLWEKVQSMDFTVDTLAALLEQEYGIPPETAARDAARVAEQWAGSALITL